MVNRFYLSAYLLTFLGLCHNEAISAELDKDFSKNRSFQDTTALDSTVLNKFNLVNRGKLSSDSVNVLFVKNSPFVHVGDYLKGLASGVLVQQPSAEPGTFQNIVVRGLSSPQFNNHDINANVAAVYVNGIPMIRENSFSSGIQRYDYNRIGPATDYLTSIDISTIQSIEVVKDPVRLAELGPLASKGAILITTFAGKSGNREISFNTYSGISTKPTVSTYNADYENRFRRQFYDKYRTVNDNYDLRYPGYLADSTNLNYYGAANWKDDYYSNAFSYNADLNIKGGTERANFGFFGGHSKNAISSDATNFKRYNVLFSVNMLPFEWLTMSTYINYRKSLRDRNKNLRDRFTEMAYLPDLSTPISPNSAVYGAYLDDYNRTVLDDNENDLLQGDLNIDVDILSNLKFTTNFSLDYNEGSRDLFYPRNLMETINYMSTFYGFSQRYIFSNKLTYQIGQESKNKLNITVGSDYQEDLYRFNFARAYNGPNDYIKLNVVNGSPDAGDYLQPQGGLRVLRWSNKEQFNMHSLYSKFNYSYDELIELNAVLRWDGASSVQRDSRWKFTPAASALWHVDKNLDLQNTFNVRASYGRILTPNFDSRFAVGPQYTGSLGWDEEPTIGSYFGYAGLSRGYNRGWVGYNLDWAYADKFEVALNNTFFNNRLNTTFAVYQSNDKNQIVNVPVPAEYGFVGEFKNGLEVKNIGLEGVISGSILKASENKLGWTSSLNFALNKNELVRLPGGLTQLEVGDRLLKVGEAIDSYYLYHNEGIYTTAGEIPQDFSFDGVPFAAGDAKWKDVNNDNIINSKDKVVQGRSTPKFFGGFVNNFTYKGFDLGFHITYALGQSALNQRASNRYNFNNNESSNSIDAVREIFHWQDDLDISKYPIYNVWSNTNPYRLDQDLFLEDASYLKLRSVTFGYDLSKLSSINSSLKNFRRAYLYVNATNLFTVTSFSGNDPELVNFNGNYDGYGLPLTKTFTLGLKLDL